MNNELTAAQATIEKCREITGCPDGVDLQDWVKQLAAENVALKAKMDKLALWPGIEFYSSSWEFNNNDGNEALEFMCDIETPATDRIVAGIKADVLPANIAEIIDSGDLETICWQHEHYKSEDYRLALYRFRTDREEAEK